MTPEKQRIAIAEACGWREVRRVPHSDGKIFGQNPNYPPMVPPRISVPDYLTDLNAMREAEMALGLKYDQWTRELRAICQRDRRCVESATATQRAEAFLRTIGKWEESA